MTKVLCRAKQILIFFASEKCISLNTGIGYNGLHSDALQQLSYYLYVVKYLQESLIFLWKDSEVGCEGIQW